MLQRGDIVVVKFGSSTLVSESGNAVNDANVSAIVLSIG
jgi:hypothetical protein